MTPEPELPKRGGDQWVPAGTDPMEDEATIMKRLGMTEWTEEDWKVFEEELKKKEE